MAIWVVNLYKKGEIFFVTIDNYLEENANMKDATHGFICNNNKIRKCLLSYIFIFSNTEYNILAFSQQNNQTLCSRWIHKAWKSTAMCRNIDSTMAWIINKKFFLYQSTKIFGMVHYQK